MSYKLIADRLGNVCGVKNLTSGIEVVIPAEGNTDYERYLSWLADGNTPEPADIPPVIFTPLSRRQFFLGLHGLGISKAAIAASIAAIPDANVRAVAQIEFEESQTFARDHMLVGPLASSFGLTEAQVDAAWTAAAAI